MIYHSMHAGQNVQGEMSWLYLGAAVEPFRRLKQASYCAEDTNPSSRTEIRVSESSPSAWITMRGHNNGVSLRLSTHETALLNHGGTTLEFQSSVFKIVLCVTFLTNKSHIV